MIEIFFAIVIAAFFSLSLMAISRAMLQGSALKESLAGARRKAEEMEQRTQTVRQDLQKMEFDLEMSETEKHSLQLQEEAMKKLAESHAERHSEEQPGEQPR